METVAILNQSTNLCRFIRKNIDSYIDKNSKDQIKSYFINLINLIRDTLCRDSIVFQQCFKFLHLNNLKPHANALLRVIMNLNKILFKHSHLPSWFAELFLIASRECVLQATKETYIEQYICGLLDYFKKATTFDYQYVIFSSMLDLVSQKNILTKCLNIKSLIVSKFENVENELRLVLTKKQCTDIEEFLNKYNKIRNPKIISSFLINCVYMFRAKLHNAQHQEKPLWVHLNNKHKSITIQTTKAAISNNRDNPLQSDLNIIETIVIKDESIACIQPIVFVSSDYKVLALYILFELIHGVQVSYNSSKDTADKLHRVILIMRDKPYLNEFGPQLKKIYTSKLMKLKFDTIDNSDSSSTASSIISSKVLALTQMAEPSSDMEDIECDSRILKYTKKYLRKHGEPSTSIANQIRTQTKSQQSSHDGRPVDLEHLRDSTKELNIINDSSTEDEENNSNIDVENNWQQTEPDTQDTIDDTQVDYIYVNSSMSEANQSSIVTEVLSSGNTETSANKRNILSQDAFKKAKRSALSGTTIPLSRSTYEDSVVSDTPVTKRLRTIQTEDYEELINTSASGKSCSLFSTSFESSVISDNASESTHKNSDKSSTNCTSSRPSSIASKIKERWRNEHLKRKRDALTAAEISSTITATQSQFSEASTSNQQIITERQQMVQPSTTNIRKPSSTKTIRNSKQLSQTSDIVDNSLSTEISTPQLQNINVCNLQLLSTKNSQVNISKKVAIKNKSNPQSHQRSISGDSKLPNMSMLDNSLNNTEDRSKLIIQTENFEVLTNLACSPRSNSVFLTTPLSAVKNKKPNHTLKLGPISKSTPITVLKNKASSSIDNSSNVNSDTKKSYVSIETPNVVHSQSTLSSQQSQVPAPFVQLARIKVRKPAALMTPIDSPASELSPLVLFDRNNINSSGDQNNAIQSNTAELGASGSTSSKLINQLEVCKIDTSKQSIDNAQSSQASFKSTVTALPPKKRKIVIPTSTNKITQQSKDSIPVAQNIQNTDYSLGTGPPIDHLDYTLRPNNQSSTKPLKSCIKTIMPVRQPSQPSSSKMQQPTNTDNSPNIDYIIQNNEYSNSNTAELNRIKIKNIFSYAEKQTHKNTVKKASARCKSEDDIKKSSITTKKPPRRRKSTIDTTRKSPISPKTPTRRKYANENVEDNLQTPKKVRKQSSKSSNVSDLQPKKITPKRRYSTRKSLVDEDAAYVPPVKITAVCSIDRVVTRQTQRLFQSEMFGANTEKAISLLTTETLDEVLKRKSRTTPKRKKGKSQSNTGHADSSIWQVTSPDVSTTSSAFKHRFTRVKSASEYLDSTHDTTHVDEQTDIQEKETQSDVMKAKKIQDVPSTVEKSQILAEQSENTPAPEPTNKRRRRLSTATSAQTQTQCGEEKRFSVVLNDCNNLEDSVNTTIVNSSEQNNIGKVTDRFDRFVKGQVEPTRSTRQIIDGVSQLSSFKSYNQNDSNDTTRSQSQCTLGNLQSEASVSLAIDTTCSEADIDVCSTGPLLKSETLLHELLETLNAHPKSRKLDLACYLCKQFIEEYKISGHNREVAEHVRRLARDIIDNVRLFQ